MKKILFLLLPILLFACQSTDKSDSITINKQWEVEGLQLNKTNLKDFEEMMKKKSISFVKDSIVLPNTDETNKSESTTYLLKNESLGLIFYFEKPTLHSPALLTNYAVSNFDKIKFEQDFTHLITKEQLDKNFKKDPYTDLFEANVNNNHVLIGVVPTENNTYELKALSVYQD